MMICFGGEQDKAIVAVHMENLRRRTMADASQVGRLALRREGALWSAYYAMPDTMSDAVHLGSIAIVAVETNPERKQAFMDMMRDVVADLIEDKVGVRPTWGEPETAPEHEWSGHS
jgi:hypothetical protein